MPYLESFVFYFAFEVNFDYIADNLTSNINPSSWLLAINIGHQTQNYFPISHLTCFLTLFLVDFSFDSP